MNPVAEVVTVDCPECGEPLTEGGQCLNIDECSRAVAVATRSATRDTAKVNVAGAAVATSAPRAFNVSGRVD